MLAYHTLRTSPNPIRQFNLGVRKLSSVVHLHSNRRNDFQSVPMMICVSLSEGSIRIAELLLRLGLHVFVTRLKNTAREIGKSIRHSSKCAH